MKRFYIILSMMAVALSVCAQPAARRQQQQQQQQRSNADNMTMRARLDFPTTAPMAEDVVWRRDIYRRIELTEDANAGLYYPVEPIGTQVNLFTYIFKLMMRGAKNGGINAYEYRMDGNETFDEKARIMPKTFLDNYHIFYERNDKGQVHIDNSDIPSREVTAYYIKESAYYDQGTSTFHIKPIALCPIMVREDDFGDGATPYPLFWIRYDDIAPYLAKQIIMTSNLNNAATMSIDDFFTRNMYKGKIYKTTNMLGRTLAQYCPTDSAMAREQRRIEKELSDFEKNIFGDPAVKDSLDSVANAQADVKEKKVRSTRRSGTSSEGDGSSVRARRQRSSSSAAPAARVTVRRQRH
ncbi:MAG: gliding motility protein GldN [Bacteroidaceae bacterium]|nr:gliding motility protein GldN [Bacteroidaceae bacterium]